MKKNLRCLVISLLMIMFISFVISGCSNAPTVNLNDYVEIAATGYNGCGKIIVNINYEALLSDYSKHLDRNGVDTEVYGGRPPIMVASYIFETYQPYELVYNTDENIQNGDKIEFEWNENADAIQQLLKVLNVTIKHKKFNYKVSGLTELIEVDPFVDVNFSCWGISGSGNIYPNADATVNFGDKNGDIFLTMSVDAPNNGQLSNGDVVRVRLKNDSESYYIKTYGVKLARTEADIELNHFAYYSSTNTHEIFDCLVGESADNALKTIEGLVFNKNESRAAEFVGALYYYQDEGNEFEFGDNRHNKIVFIYHIDNGIVPGGWYTYLSPINDVVISYERDDNRNLLKTIRLSTGVALDTNMMYYHREKSSPSIKYDYPVTFAHNGNTYIGHRTIEECLEAYQKNLHDYGNIYDHMVASESLSSYLTEY